MHRSIEGGVAPRPAASSVKGAGKGRPGGALANMAAAMRIFVSVASYCDPVLPFTLERAVATAADASRLHFGVVDQSPAGSPRVGVPGRARLSLVRVDARDARGPCWARAVAMSLHDGEDWFLQLDSHMDFDPGWDDVLVAQALALG